MIVLYHFYNFRVSGIAVPTLFIAEGGEIELPPPGSKLGEVHSNSVVDCGYVCPAFGNTFVFSS
jgi:hypothetical protein